MTAPEQTQETRQVHYEINVCGGEFKAVAQKFRMWKQEPLVSRPDQLMFTGKMRVRRLGHGVFNGSEAARHALQQASRPTDDFALAAQAIEEGRCLWIVLAAYEA